MNLRPEFQILNNHFRQLYKNKDVFLDFLNMVETHIRVCEHLAESDVEKNLIIRTTYWWKKRLIEITAKIEAGYESPGTAQEDSTKLPEDELTTNDKRFLRSLRISWEETPSQNSDDGS